MSRSAGPDGVLGGLEAITGHLEDLYRDVHQHPELSMQERRTAAKAAEQLKVAGYDVTEGVGNTGVVGVLRNGDGPTVMLRADMDALPVQEATGLPYASTATATDADGATSPVMHACGHDMHVTWLVGRHHPARPGARFMAGHAAGGLSASRGDGAGRAGDDRRRPVRSLPQAGGDPWPARHARSIREISYRPGTTQAAADSLEIRLFGRGAHGSMPESSVDPVVMAASTVLRLQTIVSREVAASQAAVVTIGALQAGTKDNVIPDDALLKLNVRTFDEAVRTRVLGAIERIVNAEAAASGAPRPPEITYTEHYPLTVNDPDETRHVADALRGYFGNDARPRTRSAGIRERGLRVVRQRVARPVGLLVRRRHRPRHLPKGPASWPRRG